MPYPDTDADPAPPPPTRPVDRLLRPVRAFAAHKLAGAGLLIAAAVAAVIIANSGWGEAWDHLLHTKVGVSFGDWQLQKSLTHWINDGLMGVFFFLVGLEIKHEVLVGELSTVRKSMLPAFAAAGGMLVPALCYYGFNPSGAEAAGWGIPMATDIAFALGVLALLGDRVPLSLKVFLTALAIVDDIGAVIVISLFYTESVSLWALLAAAGLLAISSGLNALRVRSWIAFFIVGFGVWLAVLFSGVHATVAALLMAFTIPARTWLDGDGFLRRIEQQLRRLKEVGLPATHATNSKQQQQLLEVMNSTVDRAQSPLTQLEHALVPIVTFLILPVFALANAGVALGGGDGGGLGAVALGTIVGLFLGKPVGVMLFSFFAVKIGVAELPKGVSWGHVLGAGLLAGVGFTMALFIGGLAFTDAALNDQAKIGILAASLASGIAGWAWLRFGCPDPRAAYAGGSDATSSK